MSITLDQILPSLQSLGLVGYWLIAAASALEAFFVTGIVIPGTLVVDAGGILVQRGLLDFFDLCWFVAIGSVIGSELSYLTGRLALNRLPGREHIIRSAAFARAESLFRKRGGAALVIGRFLGPVAGLVPLAAAMAGMDRRRFLVWNVIGSIPYALAHVAMGYFLADVLGRFGGSLTRIAIVGVVVALLLLLLWGILYSALRLWPLAYTFLSVLARSIGELPVLARWQDRHPRVVAWLHARVDRSRFTGLPLSVLGATFVYVAIVWLDSSVDYLFGDTMQQLDQRLAELVYHFRAPIPIRIATSITAIGDWQIVLPALLAVAAWTLLIRQRWLGAGLLVAVLGNVLTVALLKSFFGRPRSPLGYFIETSGSFPSGHAAISVAFYGTLLFVIWRAGRLRTETALLAAGLIALLLGVSRLYLVEHYLSDVLNGWLVGLLWMIVGITVSEWLATRRTHKPPDTTEALAAWYRPAVWTTLLCLAALVVLHVRHYDQPRGAPASASTVTVDDWRGWQLPPGTPMQTESLLGSALQPVTLIVFAPDASALAQALDATGWVAARPPTPGQLFDALFTAIEEQEDPSVELVSHFWRGQPASLSYVYAPTRTATQPASATTPTPATTASTTVPDRAPEPASPPAPLHARFWPTDAVTADGHRAYVGAVGIDESNGFAAQRSAANRPSTVDRLVTMLSAPGVSRSDSALGQGASMPILRLP